MQLTVKILKLAFFLASLLVLSGALLLLALHPKEATKERFRLSLFGLWSRWILRVFQIRVHNQEAPDSRVLRAEGARIIVANHVSYLDIPVIASLGPARFLAKKELAAWPLMGAIGKSLGMLFVDRSNLKSRVQALYDIEAQIRVGKSVVVFPEGTTSEFGPRRGSVPYYAGAFRVARNTGVPIEIMYLDYSPLDKCAWLGDEFFLKHLWNFLSLKRVDVRIRREWIETLPCRVTQREIFLSSRKWFLEGGHAVVSGLWKVS